MHEQAIRWERADASRVPFAVYTNEENHKKELDRLFYNNHWSYVGLEAEIPNPGDFKRTAIGERSVIMTRSQDGQIYVVENVCAHRGMAFCRERHGNKKNWCVPTTNGATLWTANYRAFPCAAVCDRTDRSKAACPQILTPKSTG